MKYMLDTDICIYIIKQRPAQVARRFMGTLITDVAMSAITYAELIHGAKKSAQVDANVAKLSALAQEMTVLPFDMEAAKTYGDVRSRLERIGRPIGANDLLIAAHALHEGLILITNNVDEFRRVDGLRVENWAANNN